MTTFNPNAFATRWALFVPASSESLQMLAGEDAASEATREQMLDHFGVDDSADVEPRFGKFSMLLSGNAPTSYAG